VFHGGFALALAEGQDLAAAVRFASTAASLKCTRLGGSMAAPDRASVEAALAAPPRDHRTRTGI
jgi:sulfofructose kinase